MNRPVKFNRRERGIALLFALGILSLLLVLALAFVTNSLLARKVAANNSNRGHAKVMAMSAINRVATAVCFYQQAEQIAGRIPEDFSMLYSYMKRNDLALNGTSGEDEVDDRLFTAGEESDTYYSLLYSKVNKEDKSQNADLAKWIFVTSKEKVAGKDIERLIGRYAYRVLPPQVGSPLNLYGLQGGYFYYDKNSAKGNPWEFRVGRDSRELNLKEIKLFASWPGSPFNGGDAFAQDEKQPSVADMNLEDLEAYLSGNGAVFTDEADKNWMRRWFEDGGDKNEIEAYPYKPDKSSTKYMHRFNISKAYDSEDSDGNTQSVKGWNSFFVESGDGAAPKNTLAAVKKLSMEDETPSKVGRFMMEDGETPEKLGIPFLKMIGHDRASFPKIADRRHQIVANLLDFVDDDSIPTSDIAAAEWKNLTKTTDSSKLPTFTGNERTAYINEVALGFNAAVTRLEESYPSCKAMTGARLQISPELVAELIRIYKDSASGYLMTALNKLTLNLKVTLKIKEVRYSYVDDKGNTFTGSITDIDPMVKDSSSFNLASPLDVAIDFPAFTSGYSAKSAEIKNADGTEALAPVTYTFQGQIESEAAKRKPAVATSFWITGVDVDFWKFELTDATFELGNLVLLDKQDGDGIDFVRWNQSDNTKLPGGSSFKLFTGFPGATTEGLVSPANANIFAGGAAEMKKSPARYFYIGGMEAIDPRQNLNADQSAPGSIHKLEESWPEDRKEKYDWTFRNFGVIASDNAGYPGAGVSGPHLSMRIVDDGSGKPSFEGLVNTLSNSNEPFGSGLSDDQQLLYDWEEEKDPAWQGDLHLSTAFIRNGGMRSFWEVGAIHRGAKWETINIKNALSRTGAADKKDVFKAKDHDPDFKITDGNGTRYERGDGAIIDQIKIVDDVRSYGKVDINMLDESFESRVSKFDATRDKQIGQMLFANVKLGQWYDILDDYATYKDSGTTISSDLASKIADKLVKEDSSQRPFDSRGALLGWEPGNSVFYEGFGAIDEASPCYPKSNDAALEELIGKTGNLMTTLSLPQRTIQAVVVAQTIKDVGDWDDPTKEVDVARLQKNGAVSPGKAKFNRFDYKEIGSDDFVYYDEITGEVKLLVTFLWDSFTGRLKVRQIEYLE